MDESVVKDLPKVDHKPADLDEPSMMLLKAAALIEERGHCQDGEGLDADGRMCVMVALGQCNNWSVITEAEERLEKTLPRFVSGDPTLRKLARWSDNTPTAEVLAKLRAVALGL